MIKRSKYGNRKVTIEGINFDSEREAKRYLILKDYQNKGDISDLKMQVVYELIPAIKELKTIVLKTKTRQKEVTIQQPITYRCDFTYIKDNVLVVEDVKISPKLLPTEYTLKKKLMRYVHGITIKEVFKPAETI